MTRSNDAYAWQDHYNVDRAYIADGLNRIMSAGGVGFTYDARGNLTSDGTNSFTYTAENLLKTGPGSATLAYDPLGRLYQTVGGGTTTRFQYDGVDLIAEYNVSNAVQRRYVHGPGIDNPIVWYEGSAINSTTRRFLMADERGSVVSVTDSAGAVLHINAYDEYGIPAPGNLGRFGYTGQAWLPEVGMWYYKARMYSPTLGRFMQTDPIGYSDGMNWYNYVGSDPVNMVDPSGTMHQQCRTYNWTYTNIFYDIQQVYSYTECQTVYDWYDFMPSPSRSDRDILPPIGGGFPAPKAKAKSEAKQEKESLLNRATETLCGIGNIGGGVGGDAYPSGGGGSLSGRVTVDIARGRIAIGGTGGVGPGLGRVDKRDSQARLLLIQDCFLRSSHGSRGFVGCGVGTDRATAAA